MTLRQLETTGQAIFGPEGKHDDNKPSFVDDFFKGELTNDFTEQHCEFSLPISIQDVVPFINGQEGEHSLMEGFISYRNSYGSEQPVYNSLNQKFLIVKLNYQESANDLTPESIKMMWKALDIQFDTSILTTIHEEMKEEGSKADLVAVVTKLKKEKGNINQVVIKIGSKWALFKNSMGDQKQFSEIYEDWVSKKHYPLLLVYKLSSNFNEDFPPEKLVEVEKPVKEEKSAAVKPLKIAEEPRLRGMTEDNIKKDSSQKVKHEGTEKESNLND